MSLENDITKIREDMFPPAGPEDLAARKVEWEKNWENRIEDIDSIRTLIEENMGKSFTDQRWIAMVENVLKESNRTFRDLEDFANDFHGLLITFDDAYSYTNKIR